MGKRRAEKQAGDRSEMSLLEHLDELRLRFTRATIALLIGMIASIVFTQPTIEILTAPAERAGVPIIVLTPTEALVGFFRVSLILGIILAMPVIVYQMFQYVRPGLEPNEKRYILIGVPFASLSFAGGAAFATFVVIPSAMPFLSGFMAELVKHQYSLDYYLAFIGNIVLWSGLVFETPLVMYFLARIGVVKAEAFSRIRRFVIVGAAVGAAVITPTPDALNMMLIMGPFLLLYELGILLAKLAQRGRD